MNRITFFLLLLVFPLTFVPQNEENRGYRVKVGDPVPPLTLQMINGEIWTNKDFIDKTVVIQFTGSWCSVCKKEMPELESRVWQNYKEKDFLLIGIDIKDTRVRMISFIEKTAVTYPMAWDPEAETFDLFTLKGAGVTRNIVINKRGEIVFLTRLFEEKEFQAMINKIDELIDL